ncbi:MAG: polyphosphate polymerase domain-containing protein [Planctomycetes bacterium]|nr:polyphosphate polymerase domain-containing protein [Planctomycetota bacterium]
MFQKTTPSIRQRYESKFVIPKEMIEPISNFASVYCSPDKHSINSHNGFYRVNNLYFDTPDFLFLMRRLDGCENRFNMRIRSYTDSRELPCFLEVKQKTGDIVNKYRAALHDKNWHKLFEDPDYTLSEEEDFAPTSYKTLFFKLAYTYNATPVMLSQYWRKAYESNVNEYARVTFDTDLRYQPAEGYCLIPDENKMVPLDDETLFDPECDVVLELKCYSMQVPLWMIDLIRYFNLQRRGFSKYVAGVLNVLQLCTYDTGARQTSSMDFI